MARKSQKKGRQDVPKGEKGKKGTAALPIYQTAVEDESSQPEQQSQPSQPLQSSRPEKTETNLAVGLQSTLTTFLAETPFGSETVIDYLAKKGYSRTEAMLRMESANQEIDGRPLPPLGEDARPKFKQGFDLLKTWVEENLDLYKPELRRVLWPLFVYSFLNMITSFYPQDAKQFFETNKNMFLPEHTDDIRVFEPISLPEHVQANSVAKLYRTNKYRIVLSNPAYTNLLQFLESKEKEGGSVMNAILSSFCTVKTMDRAADDRFSFATMLGQIGAGQSFPAEDEGIPGHHPGSAYTGDNPAMAGTLPRLRLGKMPMEPALEEDVRAELADEDAKEAPVPGRNTLVQEFDQMIKKEEDDEAPTRADIPFPPSTARDVRMEVMKVKENRDRYKIEGRTGGVGPGVSVCMFTFHNTYDGANCLDFSDDNVLVAAGFEQSYIRVWTLDGNNIEAAYPEMDDQPPANSRRLIGHSGPVYAVAFQPSATRAENVDPDDYVPTNARFLLSSSADKTIRLWSLDTWQCMVVYKGHDRPVWDLCWGPFGHYFVSGGSDRTARLWVTDHIRQQRIFVGHEQDVDCVCFHPNSAYIFTASCDHTVRMWAVTTGNAVRMFTGHTGNITAMECSRDGKILASADDQGSIFLWDLAPGRLLKRMRGHGKGGIWSLSWSVESTVLVSGGADGTVRIWDVTGPQDANQARAVGEGSGAAKIDPSNAPAGTAAQSKKKKGKDVVVTPDQISAFPTKKTAVYKVKFTNMNLVVAGGAYLP
ncbi:WD40 repeat-like protein [Penicillium longicatenatum]|uniref:WD40 repeat-like protein n=1 Tax=Penicillium longicatenatum TaxID=1561947 RepID=UPI0025476D0A|nr:WD40 repeat-like protein [Penicillium longicatenatum]KAJ5636914.1 WD40 repeat-like protein [Penicillium longicatenatum]